VNRPQSIEVGHTRNLKRATICREQVDVQRIAAIRRLFDSRRPVTMAASVITRTLVSSRTDRTANR
jgi:hypothetical protein